MEFNEKLQELRKKKGMTQEELASQLFVSRTAVSKWESGRGYPNIESLKAIARFFSVTVDELLSTDEVLAIAQDEGKQAQKRFRDTAFGIIDICMLMLLFLPLFAEKSDGAVKEISLLMLHGAAAYLKIVYFAVVLAMAFVGVLTLALKNCTNKLWQQAKTRISLALGVLAVILFVIGKHPYAAVFAFFLLIIKAALLIKHG